MPNSVTKGDSYAILGGYSTNVPSGVTTSCNSNVNGTVTDTSQLAKGSHTITCTATTGAGKTASDTKTIQITWKAYNATNLVINSSFENGLTSWKTAQNNPNITFTTNIKQLNGNYSLKINVSNPYLHEVIDSLSFITPISHYFYFTSSSFVEKIDSGYVINGELYNEEISCFPYNAILPTNVIKNNNWNKYSIVAQNNSIYNKTVFRIGIYQGTATYSDGIAYFDNIMAIDLTETFGSGNEPDKEWCDKHINYFDGTTTIYK